MSERKYGKMNKKVVFYDTDKRFADLKIRLGHDKISQAQFFRSVVTGYIEQDEDMLNFIDNYSYFYTVTTESCEYSILHTK